jgi:hypothetical protein
METGRTVVGCIGVSQDRNQWKVALHIVMKSLVS